MKHYMLDSYNCYRTRLEDIGLVSEVLERIPYVLGTKAVMPPFIRPYYNGVVPEDCGISAFVFLKGGHFTIHTFSYRECYFVDFTYKSDFNANKLTELIVKAFPTEKYNKYFIDRNEDKYNIFNEIDRENDFGPHVFMKYNPKGKITMDYLFDIFDKMPEKINMTPIMRPYIIKTQENIYSALTMIAESHISLHYFENTNTAYFDIFSCKFFDEKYVIPKIIEIINADEKQSYTNISRGSKYTKYKSTKESKLNYSTQWL